MTAPQPECAVPLVEVSITEELGLACLPEAGVVFDELLSLRPEHVVLDLSDCGHIDAAALGLLLDVHRRLARRRAVLSVRNPNPRITRILQTTHLDQVLPIIPGPTPAGTAPAAHGQAPVTARP